tara:strand:- start:416 stop:805 length:390 start_codon:yes stop_codon:yes gene_type:complete
MQILGNGVDIIENYRIKKLIKNESFLKRIYTKREILNSKKIRNKINYFAKRFAAKEALVKALGLGFRNNINFNDIEIINDFKGKPLIKVSKKIKNYLRSNSKFKKYKIHLSLSDEKKYSIAYVIIDSNR